ncbi:hypothetical protein CP533_6459 [Ophiocordyceps camponoti-saundersi (nom. inval.)]|nr:hypothetical protein CP533_6459 [Ophiocordyceps camponoti-saundersi (nom. inval.)]
MFAAWPQNKSFRQAPSTFLSVRDKITSPHDREYQFPVRYAFDYLHGGIKYLQRPQLELNNHVRSRTFLKLPEAGQDERQKTAYRSDHAIDLFPLAAGLPWPCGILTCRQSKHWKLSLEAMDTLLKEFAASDGQGVVSKSGKSIPELAQKELASNSKEGWAKFPAYLFSEADEERTKLLGAVNVFIFLFDDFWEMHELSTFFRVQEVFVDRMRPESHRNAGHKSSLESMIEKIITRILELDEQSGNDAGRDMIELMVRFFTRPAPPEKYDSMEDFLLYRIEDAAVPYVLGCTKFSLNSSVDLESSRLARYLRLVKDHVSIANDLGSWDKEKAAYDSGHVLYMINVVDVVKHLFSCSTFEAAVAISQGLQYEIECQIDEELKRLIREDALTAEEWRFVDATLSVMSGNVLVSTIMSRYGGEGWRLQ